ncbi:hypothetical protein BC829DRAFT_404180 [Chytridium lagenaria]|nr:hypothetical protein BC829DRAFT_404180 [Chytridium lagenaria]
MGVKNLWIAYNERFSRCFKPIRNQLYDHVMLDFNSILHRSAGGTPHTTTTPHLLRTVFHPIDGAAPFAKLLQQRERRRAMSQKRVMTTGGAYFNRVVFTPGTGFMDDLDGGLRGYAEMLMERIPGLEEIVISGARMPGEGEVNIQSPCFFTRLKK